MPIFFIQGCVAPAAECYWIHWFGRFHGFNWCYRFHGIKWCYWFRVMYCATQGALQYAHAASERASAASVTVVDTQLESRMHRCLYCAYWGLNTLN